MPGKTRYIEQQIIKETSDGAGQSERARRDHPAARAAGGSRASEGDTLEAEAVEGGILLKPVSAAEREAAWQRMQQAMASVRYVGPGPEPSDDELMEEIVQVVKEVRKEMARERARRR